MSTEPCRLRAAHFRFIQRRAVKSALELLKRIIKLYQARSDELAQAMTAEMRVPITYGTGYSDCVGEEDCRAGATVAHHIRPSSAMKFPNDSGASPSHNNVTPIS
jgi:acyl-CoA reductase-like NAD-dependent aldehyde dehydrogenase